MNPCKALFGLLSASLFLALTLDAAGASHSWKSFYAGGGGASYREKLAQDAQGNVYVGGSGFPGGSHGRVSIVKYDASGRRVWNYIYDSDAESDDFSSFAVTADGSVYVALTRYTPTASLAVFKLDPNGTLLWEKRDEGYIASLTLDAVGNVFVAGLIDPEGEFRASLLIKYGPDGTKLWERRFHVLEQTISAAISAATDTEGNVFVVGFGFAISKFDGEGTVLWEKNYEGQSAYTVIVDSDGNAYVTGQHFAAGALTVKLDSHGQELWQDSYSQDNHGSDVTEPCDLALDPQGNLYVSTRKGGIYDLTKLTADGSVLWRNRETGRGSALFSSVAVDQQGHSWLFLTKPVSATADDVVLTGYDTDGKLTIKKRFTHGKSGRAGASDLLLDLEGNPVATFRAVRKEGPAWITIRTIRPRRWMQE